LIDDERQIRVDMNKKLLNKNNDDKNFFNNIIK